MNIRIERHRFNGPDIYDGSSLVASIMRIGESEPVVYLQRNLMTPDDMREIARVADGLIAERKRFSEKPVKP